GGLPTALRSPRSGNAPGCRSPSRKGRCAKPRREGSSCATTSASGQRIWGSASSTICSSFSCRTQSEPSRLTTPAAFGRHPSSREEGKASRSHLSPPHRGGVPAQPAGWSDFSENQIPDAVAEREAAALELGFRSSFRPARVSGSRVPQRRLGGAHLQHLPTVFLPIGAG